MNGDVTGRKPASRGAAANGVGGQYPPGPGGVGNMGGLGSPGSTSSPTGPGNSAVRRLPMRKLPSKEELQSFQRPDFSRREEFEAQVFEDLGGNPFDIDLQSALQEADKRLPDLFHHVFQNKIIWQDRGKMSKEQARFWDDVVKWYHAKVYNSAKSMREQKMAKYNWMMNKFDNYQKDYEAAEKRLGLDKPASTEAPTEKLMVNAQGVQTFHRWDPGSGQWVDTGKEQRVRTAEEKMPDIVKRSLALVTKYSKGLDPTMAALMYMATKGDKDLKKKVAANPFLGRMLGGFDQVPRHLKPSFDKALRIVSEYYEGLEMEDVGSAGSAGSAGKESSGSNTSVTHEYDPVRGLTVIKGKIKQ